MTWFLLGVIAGIIIGVLIDRDTVYRTVQKFGKIKIKKSGDVTDLIDITPTKKELRQREREIKREDRQNLKRNKQSTP